MCVVGAQPIWKELAPRMSAFSWASWRPSKAAGWRWDGTVSRHDFDCANRPVVGVNYPPVEAYVAASLCCPQTREQKEPPEPNRPKCR